MKNHLTLKSLAVTLILTLSAVGIAQNTTLRFITGDWVEGPLGPFIEEFERQHDVEIVFEDYPFRELFETIEVRARAQDDTIDMVLVDSPLVASYALRGHIRPLDDLFTEEEIQANLTGAALEIGYWDDTLYAPPLNNSSQVLFYNIDLLEAAGIDLPPADVDQRWTWEEVAEAAQQLTDRDQGVWGFAFDQINRYYQLQVLPESLGGGPGVSEDGLSVSGYLTNDAWIEAFTFYRDLFQTWHVSPTGVAVDQVPELFAAGNIALFVGGLWNIVDFEEAGVNFAVAPHPYFADGEPATPSTSWNLGVWSWSQQPELVKELIRHLLLNPEVNISWLEQHGQFPSHVAALEHIVVSEQFEAQPRIAYRIAAFEAEHTSVARAGTPAYLEFEEILTDTFEDIRNGADPETALAIAEQRLERAMTRYR